MYGLFKSSDFAVSCEKHKQNSDKWSNLCYENLFLQIDEDHSADERVF